MTRLQKMFIELSECKTVEELEKTMSKGFVKNLVSNVAFDKSGKVHTCGYFKSCNDCDLSCLSADPVSHTIYYLNEEIGGSHYQQNSIVIMRGKALDELEEIFIKACKVKANPLLTAVLLDSYCNMFEKIGLFESGECHYRLAHITREKIKK